MNSKAGSVSQCAPILLLAPQSPVEYLNYHVGRRTDTERHRGLDSTVQLRKEERERWKLSLDYSVK